MNINFDVIHEHSKTSVNTLSVDIDASGKIHNVYVGGIKIVPGQVDLFELAELLVTQEYLAVKGLEMDMDSRVDEMIDDMKRTRFESYTPQDALEDKRGGTSNDR